MAGLRGGVAGCVFDVGAATRAAAVHAAVGVDGVGQAQELREHGVGVLVQGAAALLNQDGQSGKAAL